MTILEAYSVLSLDPSTTTPDKARSRFRDLIRSHHPDGKPSHEQVRANEATRDIIEAITLLRTEGFPRVAPQTHTGAQGASEPTEGNERNRYERQATAEPVPADPLSWVDEVWRESVRTEPPETAITNAALKTLWWGIFSAVLLWFGAKLMLIPNSGAKFIGLMPLGFGFRFALGAWMMGKDVLRYWRVFSRTTPSSTVAVVRSTITRRLGLAIAGVTVVVALGLVLEFWRTP